jgi:ATP-binding cassette subfamily B protein
LLVLNAVTPALVVVTLGAVVGEVPGAVEQGLSSADGHRLILALVVAAVG